MNEQILQEVYYHPRTGFRGPKDLYERVKHKGITLQQVKNWLKKQESYQITRKTDQVENRQVLAPVGTYFIDLAFLPDFKRQNGNHVGFMSAVHAVSRYARVYIIKKKTIANLLAVLKQFIEDTNQSLWPVTEIESDNEAAFMSKVIQTMLNKSNIKHITFDRENHNALGIVERFHRTIKAMINRVMVGLHQYDYINWIDDLVDNYNDTIHSSIKVKPNEVDKMIANEILTKILQNYKVIKPLQIRDKVRLKETKTVFDKETVNYSHDIYEITGKDRQRYWIKKIETGRMKRHSVARKNLLPIKEVETNKEHPIKEVETIKKHPPTYKKVKRQALVDRRQRREPAFDGDYEKQILFGKRQRRPRQRLIAEGLPN